MKDVVVVVTAVEADVWSMSWRSTPTIRSSRVTFKGPHDLEVEASYSDPEDTPQVGDQFVVSLVPLRAEVSV